MDPMIEDGVFRILQATDTRESSEALRRKVQLDPASGSLRSPICRELVKRDDPEPYRS